MPDAHPAKSAQQPPGDNSVTFIPLAPKWRRTLLPYFFTLAATLPIALSQLVIWWQGQREPQLWPSASRLLAWLTPAAMLIAGSVGFWVGYRLSRRLSQIDSALQRMQKGDYGTRLAIGPADEIGMLARRVNLLMASAAGREEFIRRDALTDPLTRLPNRTLLVDRIDLAVAEARRASSQFSVLLLDLDRFKFVNDTLGHAAGDVLLCEVAQRLKRAVRDNDTVARLGGDEFVLLLRGDHAVALEVANRVHKAMRKPIRFREQLIDVGVSIGIAMHPKDGRDATALLRNADIAMYKAKRQQLGTHAFDGEVQQIQRSYLSLLGEMRHALETHQFELDYQPKMNLASGLIVGVEGLLRWRHPTRGRVPPGDFIPFAEQTGFLRELTQWVVAEGARFAKEIRKAGLSLRVSVNIAAQDIQSEKFCALLRNAIERHGIEPAWLCLEITESGFVTETQRAMDNLAAIAELGVHLSVDDFGTGYATLAQLQRLPVQELKIDRSFVTDMHMNRGNQTIVRSTIDLAKQLGLSVVAEGVETLVDLRCLTQLGCDEIQGYYLAKPMLASELPGWIATRQPVPALPPKQALEAAAA